MITKMFSAIAAMIAMDGAVSPLCVAFVADSPAMLHHFGPRSNILVIFATTYSPFTMTNILMMSFGFRWREWLLDRRYVLASGDEYRLYDCCGYGLASSVGLRLVAAIRFLFIQAAGRLADYRQDDKMYELLQRYIRYYSRHFTCYSDALLNHRNGLGGRFVFGRETPIQGLLDKLNIAIKYDSNQVYFSGWYSARLDIFRYF